MRRLILLLAIVGFNACATPEYVLHGRAPTEFWNFLRPPKEDAPIATVDGVALLYDRTRWVISERELNDGSAWVHYAIDLKNTTEQAVRLDSRSVRLEGAQSLKAPAIFEKADKAQGFDKVEGKTLSRVTVKFHLPKEMVAMYGGSSDPVELVVPLQGKGELRQKVWLWKE